MQAENRIIAIDSLPLLADHEKSFAAGFEQRAEVAFTGDRGR